MVLRAKHQPGQAIPEEAVTVAESITAYEQDYWQTRKRLPNTELSWQRYQMILNRLPANGVMSLGLLQQGRDRAQSGRGLARFRHQL